MTEDQLAEYLKMFKLSLPQICEMIRLKTGYYMQPSHIKIRFKRGRTLSVPMSAALGLFFEGLKRG